MYSTLNISHIQYVPMYVYASGVFKGILHVHMYISCSCGCFIRGHRGYEVEQNLWGYVRTCSNDTTLYVSQLVILSLKIKRTDWSTFAMYWGTTLTLLVMYPGF